MIHLWKRKLIQNRLNADIGLATHTGRVRKLNEDSIVCTDLTKSHIAVKVCAVADGLGGYEGGEIASKTALDVFVNNLNLSIGKMAINEKELVSRSDITTNMLIEAVQAANAEVYTMAQSGNKRMATTLTAALLIDTKAYIANIGDSRAYYLDNNNLRQITRDHSLVAELVASGMITADEIYTHPQRNLVTRCLGVQSDVAADTFVEVLKPGNILLICSDGLWEMVRDKQIKEILMQTKNAQSACDRLVETANNNGGIDNISVIVIRALQRNNALRIGSSV